jgi:GTP-binding protein
MKNKSQIIHPLRSVALVGRPNVGKSRLFNRLVGKRLSIVHDQAGVTRDVVTAEVDNNYTLMDTGGIGMIPKMTPTTIAVATEDQVDFAIDAAQVILFVCDGREGWTSVDAQVAQKLRRHTDRIILVVNKIDLPQHEDRMSEFYNKGFGDPIMVSAEHGYHADELREMIAERLGPAPEVIEEEKEAESRRTQIAFVGRPNVGKSSLSNRLMGQERLIVSPIAGTTRDSIHVDFNFRSKSGKIWPFTIVDTAGLRPKAKVDSSLEYFASVRSHDALAHVDVVFLVIEAKEGITTQDKRLADEIIKEGRALSVVVNKWDESWKAFKEDGLAGYDSEHEFRDAFEAAIRKQFFFLPDLPIVFASAHTGEGMETLLKTARDLKRRQDQTLSTSKVNRVLHDLIEAREPKLVKGGRFKIYYALQVRHRPHTIRLYCNKEAKLSENYLRYLMSNFATSFDLAGCPLKFEMFGKKPRSK